MGIPIVLDMDEGTTSSTSFKHHRDQVVIHHHLESSSAPSPVLQPPSLPPRHPNRRLTQHHQSLRQHYEDQAAIHRHLTSIPPPQQPLPLPPRLTQDQDRISDEIRTQLQPQEQEHQMQGLSPSQQQRRPIGGEFARRSSASALFRYYHQQQQQRQQQQQQQQQQQPRQQQQEAHRTPPDEEAVEQGSHHQQRSMSSLSLDQEQDRQQNQAMSVQPSVRDTTLSTVGLTATMPSSATTMITTFDAVQQESTGSGDADLAEQERTRAWRRAAEYERQKMALERTELRRRVQHKTSWSRLSTATKTTTPISPLRDRLRDPQSRYKHQQQGRPSLRPLSVTSTRLRSSLDHPTGEIKDTDSGVDINPESEEDFEDNGEQPQPNRQQQQQQTSLGAGRHHHRSFYALGPHHRVEQIRSAIQASWPAHSAAVIPSVSSETTPLDLPVDTDSPSSSLDAAQGCNLNNREIESDTGPCFVISSPTTAISSSSSS